MLKRLLNFCQSQSVATRLLYIDIIHRQYYIYSHTTYRVLYIMVLYRYIVRYYAIMILCYDILWLYALMQLYEIMRKYRAIILCDTVGLLILYYYMRM